MSSNIIKQVVETKKPPEVPDFLHQHTSGGLEYFLKEVSNLELLLLFFQFLQANQRL